MAKLRVTMTITYDLDVPDKEWEGPDDEYPICPMPWPVCNDCQLTWNPLSDASFNDPDATFIECDLDSVEVDGAYCLHPFVGPDGELDCNCSPISNCPVAARRRNDSDTTL